MSSLCALCCMVPVTLSGAVLGLAFRGGQGSVLRSAHSRAGLVQLQAGWRPGATLCNSSCCGIQSHVPEDVHPQAALRQPALAFCCCISAIVAYAGALFMLVQVLSHPCHSQATQSPAASDSLS